MKIHLTMLGLILFHCNLLGQVSTDSTLRFSDSTYSDSSIIKQQKEQKPILVGGVYSLVQNIKYPDEAIWEPGKIENKNADMAVLIPLNFEIR